MDPKVLEVLGKGLGLETPDAEAVKAALGELGVPDGAIFTQTELNAILAKDKRAMRQESDDLKKRDEAREAAFREQSQKLTGLLEKFDNGTLLPDGVGGDDADKSKKSDDPNAVIVGTEKRIQAQIKELTQKLENQGKVLQDERKLREEAERITRAKERDDVLIAAARRAGMIEPEVNAPLHYTDRLRKDEKGAWVFMRESDELPAESIEEGVKDALNKRPYLREPKNLGGGGSQSGSQADPVKQLEAECEAAKKQVALNPRNDGYVTQLQVAHDKLAAARKNKK